VRNKKGSILIIVLWALFFLAMLAMAIGAYVRPQLDLSKRMLDNTKMRYLARAGVERAVFEVENDKTDDYDGLLDSWSANDEAFKNAELDGGTFSVMKSRRSSGEKEEYGLIDEERKININKAPYNVLKNLFEIAAQAGEEDAGIMADCVLDWRDEDDSLHKAGAEEEYYSSLAKPYHCKNGDFECLEELLQVKGVTPEIFDKVKDIITIYGDGVVNINTAGIQALQIVGIDGKTAQMIINLRQVSVVEREPGAPAGAFTDTASMMTALNEKGALSGAEAGEMPRVVGAGARPPPRGATRPPRPPRGAPSPFRLPHSKPRR